MVRKGNGSEMETPLYVRDRGAYGERQDGVGQSVYRSRIVSDDTDPGRNRMVLRRVAAGLS